MKHRTIVVEEIENAVRMQQQLDTMDVAPFIILKCEPFILHVQCKNLEAATNLYQLSMACGYRESGIGIGNKKIMVAVRTTSLTLELPIAMGTRMFFDHHDLSAVVNECNTRLIANFNRISRFLNVLKEKYAWPTFLRHRSLIRDNDIIYRYGHVSLLTIPKNNSATGRLIVSIGGSGGRIDGSGDSRGVPHHIMTLPPSSQPSQRIDEFNGWSPTAKRATHSVVAYLECALTDAGARTRVGIMSGGRNSPRKALPCILDAFLTISPSETAANLTACELVSFRSLSFEESGDIPSPRWGHSLTRFDVNRLVLTGGRDDSQVFADAFFLEAVPESIHKFQPNGLSARKGDTSAIAVRFKWTRLPFPSPQVFFHSACPIGKGQVLLCGGLGPEYIRANFVGATASSISPSETPSGISHSWLLTRSALHFQHFKSTPRGQNHLPTNVSDEREDFDSDALAQELCWIQVQVPSRQRFGHTVTYLGGKCVAVVGGASFSSSDSSDTERSSQHLEVWDMLVTFVVDNPPTVSASVRYVRVRGSPDSLSSTEHLDLEVGSLRCHHQACFDSERHQLIMTGGGLSCAGLFGTQYCPSLLLQVCCESQVEAYFQESATLCTSQDRNLIDPAPMNSSRNITAEVLTIIVHKKRLKNTKAYLESKGWLNKAVRISKPSILCGGLHCDDVKAGADADAVCVTLSKSSADEQVSCSCEAITAEEVTQRIHDINDVMAVPITESFFEMVSACKSISFEGQHKAALQCGCSLDTFSALYSLLVAEVIPPIRNYTDIKLEHKEQKHGPSKERSWEEVNNPHIELLFIRQNSMRTKSALASIHDCLISYLTSIIPRIAQTNTCARELTAELTADLPKKFEVIGDVLMIGENCLRRVEWLQFFPTDGYHTLWEALLDCYNSRGKKSYYEDISHQVRKCLVTRVARKAEIDLGPKRESKIRLLYPSVSDPPAAMDSAGPEGLGWVEVVENGINYGFDITKVM